MVQTCRDAFTRKLDEGIERWTQLEKYALMEKCQAAGVRAMAIQSPEDRVEHDPQLRARGFYTELEHPLLGRYKIQGFPSSCRKHPPRSPGQRRSSASIPVRCSPNCWG